MNEEDIVASFNMDQVMVHIHPDLSMTVDAMRDEVYLPDTVVYAIVSAMQDPETLMAIAAHREASHCHQNWYGGQSIEIIRHTTKRPAGAESVDMFLKARTQPSAGTIAMPDLHQAYLRWVDAQGDLMPLAINAFGRTLRSAGYTSTRKMIDNKLTTVYLNISLK